MDNPFPWLLGICAVLIVGLVWLNAIDQKEWDAFSATHRCVIVGKTQGETQIVIGGNGGTVYTPPKTGWKCDDGITYWR